MADTDLQPGRLPALLPPPPEPPAPAPETLVTNKPDYSRLTRSDIGVLLKLHRDGLTQAEIAKRLGCNQPTVHRWLSDLADTTEPSKQYLRGQALRMAQNIVKKGLPRDHVKVLEGLDVLAGQASTGLVIQIGGTGHDVKIALLSPAVADGT